MTPPHFPARTTSVPTAAQRFMAGGWYYVLTIASVGFLAAVPFWHAASRLGLREVRGRALIFTAAVVYLAVLTALTPRKADGTSANEALSGLFAFSALVVVVAACIQLRPLRRAVFGGGGVVPVHADPVVARALGARARREETRQLLARDPRLQRDLGIGRPDLGRGYDDGGLIDVNTASAEVIMRVADLDRGDAEAIVAGRAARGGSWYDVAELIDNVRLSPSAQEQLRERAVF